MPTTPPTASGSESQSYFDPLFDGFLIMLSVAIIAINAMVIFLFFRREYLQTKTNSLLLSLAFSDLSVGLLGIPTNILCNAMLEEPVCVASVVLYRFVGVSTMYHILVITLERYTFVIYPMKYINIVTVPRLMKLIATVWFFSLFVSLIRFSWNEPDKLLEKNLTQRIKDISLIYNIAGAVFCFLLPLVIMAISYGRMFLVIHRQVKEIKSQYRHCRTAGARRKPPIATEARALIIFATMLVIFAVCWSSWYVLAILLFTNNIQVLPVALLQTMDFCRFGVALVNPILYAFLKRDFARALRSLFKRDGVQLGRTASERVRTASTMNVSLSKVSDPAPLRDDSGD